MTGCCFFPYSLVNKLIIWLNYTKNSCLQILWALFNKPQVKGDYSMAVKIFIKRVVKENKAKDLLPFFRQLRNLATSQPGYISGETLKRTDNPDQYLIISSWQSLDSWGQWAVSRERIKIQNKIDNMLDEEAIYEIYQYG